MDVRVRFRSVTIFGVALQHSKSYPDCMAWLAALSLVIVLAAPGVVDACSCVERVPCQTFWSADAVFTGVVTSVTWSGDQKQARSHTTIIVERGFKGESGQIVLTGIGMSTCRYDFTVGERYFVYANRLPDGTFTTSICAGNRPFAEAGADLDYAEHLPPPGSGGRVFGRVRRIEQDLLDRRKSRDKFPAGIAILLRDSSGAAIELRTDVQGRFEATGLKPDKYSVSLDAPASAHIYSPPTIELHDRGCVPLGLAYTSNGRIEGRIVDARGLPASKVSVSAFPSRFTTKRDYPEASLQSKATDADGRFEIGPLPPGDYHVAVNFEWPPRLESPYPPTYYPGVLARADAVTITLRDGDRRRANFVLPSRLIEVPVSGRVMFPDGTPAPGVDVSLVAGTVSGISSTRTNASGSFTLTGLSRSTYSLRASFYKSPEDNGWATMSVSLADESVTDLQLVLKKR
jgi:hypothetical protein